MGIHFHLLHVLLIIALIGSVLDAVLILAHQIVVVESIWLARILIARALRAGLTRVQLTSMFLWGVIPGAI